MGEMIGGARTKLSLMISLAIVASYSSTGSVAQERAVQGGDALSTVVVTGSRTETRTAAESLAPIDVISGDDLARSGRQNLREALAAQVPSYSNDAGFTGASGIGVKSATLRGLSGNHVLVLVNGKRRHTSAHFFHQAGSAANGQSAADLDFIPVAAVERVEVLRDGAAAQYGSDAIAGVINIILKSNSSGGTASALYGQYPNADEGGKGSKGANGQAYLNQGFSLPNDGFISVTGDLRAQETSNVAGPVPDSTRIYADANDPREFGLNRHRQTMGQPRQQAYNLAYNLGIPLAGEREFYSNATFSHRYSLGFGTYRPAQSAQNIPEVYPDGFQPKFISVEDDLQLTAGVRDQSGSLLGWDWDFSSSIGRNAVNYRNEDSLNPSFGTDSKTDFDNGDAIFSQWTNNFDIKRSFDTGLFDTPLHVAAGLEYRYDKYQIRAGEYQSWASGPYYYTDGPNVGKKPNGGSAGWGGFEPQSAGSWGRSNNGAWLDFTQRLTDKWEASLATRFEHYSDAGDTASGKLSTRYQLTPRFAIRGAVNNGFRAPSLQQQHFSSFTSAWTVDPLNSSNFYATLTSYATVNSVAARALGAEDLKPEESLNYSIGFVFTPFENANVTLDFYQIDISDRIIQATNLNGRTNSRVADLLNAVGADPNQTVSYYGNLADTRTQGIDLVADYRTDFGRYGNVKWTLTSTQTRHEIQDIHLPAVLQGTGVEPFSRSRQGNFTSAYPKNVTGLSALWRFGNFEVAPKVTRYSQVIGRSDYGSARDETIDPAFIADLDVGYYVTDALKLSLGGKNIFNKRADELTDEAKTYNFWPISSPAYSWYSPYGVDGGYYYARVDYYW